MEPIRPAEAELGYNADAVRPFLGRPSAERDDFFRGEAAFPGTLRQDNDNFYYFHATTLGNLPGILERGLDPQMGGRGGAGQLIAAPVDQETGNYFARRDAGFVYLAENAEIAARYAFQYDDQADGYIPADAYGNPERIGETNIQRSAVILRIREESLNPGLLRHDTAEADGAYRTNERLLPSNLELLTEGGWVPLRDRELRQEIYNNVNHTLGRVGPNNLLPEDENDIRERVAREQRETEGAGTARPFREETSLEELSHEESPRRESKMTLPAPQRDHSYDKGADLK